MAKRSITELRKEFANKVYKVKETCEKKGIDMLFYCTYRSPQEQAKLFRKGRTHNEIIQKMNDFENAGIPELANIIENVGPQRGEEIVTYAGPFESWHQYREAADGVPVEDGKALWNDTGKFEIYGRIAGDIGLIWAGNWDSFTEYPHIQLRNVSNPFDVFSKDAIKQMINELK